MKNKCRLLEYLHSMLSIKYNNEYMNAVFLEKRLVLLRR